MSATRPSDASRGSFSREPGWNTTPSAPIASPIRSECVSDVCDFLRMSLSFVAAFTRYTAWITTDLIGPSSISSRKAAMSGSFHCVGRHIRGDWLNTWIASQPRFTPRSCAFTRPPAVDTWPPISIL